MTKLTFGEPIPEYSPKTNQPNQFVRLDEGKPVTVQLLESNYEQYFKYWFKDSTGRWIGYICEDMNTCPVVQRNRVVGKNSPDYIKPQKRFGVNVLDLTPMITCPECKTAYWPQEKPNNCDCGTSLVNVEPTPLNMVRILERGPQLFNQINVLATTVGDVTSYPMMIVRSGTKNSTVATPIPQPHLEGVDIEDYEDQLLPLPQGIRLSPEEVTSILDEKVPLSDILAARNAEDAISSVEDSLFD